jgi:hypothetical protein
MDEFSITKWASTAIDYWWAWAVPAVIIYILRNYIRNLWYRGLMKWSEAPYCNVGNTVQFSEKGTRWKIALITNHSVYLENTTKENGDLDFMRVPIDKYYNSTLIYKRV